MRESVMVIIRHTNLTILRLLLAIFVCLSFQSRAAYTASLAISGVSGPGANGTIPVLSYSFGVSKYGGSPSFSPVSVSKVLDLTSPLLAFQCAKGVTNSTAVLTVVNSATGNTLYTVSLGNVSIISDQISGGSDVPDESVSLNYNTIAWTYQPTDGSAPVTHSWNVADDSGH